VLALSGEKGGWDIEGVDLQYTPLSAVGVGRGADMSQGSTPYGIRFSHKTYRPSPTKDVT
jgi:hypothetical protein